MRLLRPEIFRDPEVCCALALREPGSKAFEPNFSFNVGDDEAHVTASRSQFLGEIHCSGESLAIPRQVHGRIVVRADHPGLYDSCDGLVTRRRGICLGVLFADCVPLFFFDPVRRAVAAVHAGWRGTAGRIAVAAVETMREECGSSPGDLEVFVGPAAGACCYEVSHHVADAFDRRDVRNDGGRLFLDLKGANARQLADAGVSAGRVQIHPSCTIEEPQFHSHRRDGAQSGRLLGVIALKDPATPR